MVATGGRRHSFVGGGYAIRILKKVLLLMKLESSSFQYFLLNKCMAICNRCWINISKSYLVFKILLEP